MKNSRQNLYTLLFEFTIWFGLAILIVNLRESFFVRVINKIHGPDIVNWGDFFTGTFPMNFRIGSTLIQNIFFIPFEIIRMTFMKSYKLSETVTTSHLESFYFISMTLLSRVITFIPHFIFIQGAVKNIKNRIILYFSLFVVLIHFGRDFSFLNSFDFYAGAFLVIVLHQLIKCEGKITFRRWIPMLIAGQLIIENLGAVTGLSIFFSNLFLNGPKTILKEFKALGAFALISLTLAASFFITSYVLNGEISFHKKGSDIEELYIVFGKTNFLMLGFLVKSLLEVFIPIFVLGNLLGLFVLDSLSKYEIRLIFKYSLAILLSFFITVYIGMYSSGLVSEYIRQVYPSIAIFFIFSMAMGRLIKETVFAFIGTYRKA